MLRLSHHGRVAVLLSLGAHAALAGCVKDSGLIPGGGSAGPDGRSIARDPGLHDVYFPITAGAHGGADCNTCHGGTDSFKAFTCFACHDHDQPVTDASHASRANYRYESAACYGCHPRGRAVIDRAAHEVYFPISAGATHGAVECASCHADPADRRAVDCTGCHDHAEAPMAARHQGLAGYEWTTAGCRGCHPKGEVHFDRSTHDEYFFIGEGTAHASTACAGCHTQPTDRLHVECTSCHDHAQATTDPLHALIDGYAYQDAECRRCHPKGDLRYDRSTHAANFPIDTGSAHQGTGCAECHTDPSDRRVVGCIACHEHAQATMQTAHARVGNYQYSDAYCLRCHDTTPAFRISAHTAFRVTHGVGRGQPGRCLECHDRMQPAPKSWAADFGETNCSHNTAGCHSD